MSEKKNPFNPFESLTEGYLDHAFLGQLTLHQMDSYKTVKAGSHSIFGVVRSKIYIKKGQIRLVCFLPRRENVRFISCNAGNGITGKITERTKCSSDEDMQWIPCLYLHYVSPEDMMTETPSPHSSKFSTFRGKAEFDDLIFNLDESFVFDVTYFCKNNPDRNLMGLEMYIPLEKFNKYVYNRNLWYRDYKGSKTIPLS